MLGQLLRRKADPKGPHSGFRAALQTESSRAIEGLLRLVDLTGHLAREQNLDSVLSTIATLAGQAVGCERASVFLHDEPKAELATRVTTELEVKEIRVRIGDGVVGWVARHRTPANVFNPPADPRWSHYTDRATGYITKNLLTVPLLTPDDRLVGVLQLLNKEGGFDGFDERLATAFGMHAAIALERARLVEEVSDSVAMRADLDVARRVQESFLPKTLPTIPNYELAAHWQPAEDVGGDYYDVLPLPCGKMGLVIADVSGHGVGASLLMAEVRAMLHVLTRTESDAGRIVSLLSETIASDLASGRFVTLFFAVLDPHAHELTVVNAGHGPVLRLDRAAGTCSVIKSTNLPLGFTNDHRYESSGPLPLNPGDLVLLATDGSIELQNAAQEMFGRERLERLLLEHQKLPATAVVAAIQQALARFQQGPPRDDMTLLLLERKLGDT